MSKISKSIFVGVFVFMSFFMASSVLAQSSTDESVSTTMATDSASSESVQATTSVRVPGAWGLFWLGLKERISLAVTFDPVKKADKLVTFAQERLDLAQAMAQKAGDDPVLQRRSQQMVEKADEFMKKLEDRKEQILQKADERSQRVLNKAAAQITHREEVINRIEARLSSDDLGNLQKLRQKGLEDNARLLNAINNENISPETKAHLEDVKQRIDTHLEEVKTFLTEKKDLLEKAQNGDEDAREELKNLREQMVSSTKERMEANQELMQEKREVREEVRIQSAQQRPPRERAMRKISPKIPLAQ